MTEAPDVGEGRDPLAEVLPLWDLSWLFCQ